MEGLGLRLNDWTSLAVFLAAVAYLILASRSSAQSIHADAAGAGKKEDGADHQQGADV